MNLERVKAAVERLELSRQQHGVDSYDDGVGDSGFGGGGFGGGGGQ